MTSGEEADITSPWQAVLDDQGVVVEHRMTLRRGGAETVVRTDERGFAVQASPGRILVGARSDAGTSLTMVDARRVCRLWQRDLDRLAYDVTSERDAGRLRLAVHDPVTRDFEGELLIDAEVGTTEALIDGECSSSCQPNDGEIDPAALGPIVAARPVPAFASGGWPGDTVLPFSWQAGEVPPRWARDPISAAADDAGSTSLAASPRFVFRERSGDTIRYTSTFPEFCRFGIACASRNMPSFWAVWLRPHSTDLSWGTLRWCQRASGPGCFDVRRVVLHELGHVIGLDHPSSEGFRLEADETVMHAITPARPSPGASRHAFGRCDVATLQEIYDVPTNRTPISTCNDVATRLSLRADAATVLPGEPIRLTAMLRVADRDAFGQLAGNVLNDRTVRLRFRRAGSDDDWTTVVMTPRPSGGRYDAEIASDDSLEVRALFPSPRDEGLAASASRAMGVTVEEAFG